MTHEQPDWIITADELRPLLGRVVLLDVREQEEYAQSRIEGCTLIPLGELLQRAPRELGKDRDIVIYCAHGVRSQHALTALAGIGYTRLRSLKGGIAAWELDKLT